jgi:hypothetical protein
VNDLCVKLQISAQRSEQLLQELSWCFLSHKGKLLDGRPLQGILYSLNTSGHRARLSFGNAKRVM